MEQIKFNQVEEGENMEKSPLASSIEFLKNEMSGAVEKFSQATGLEISNMEKLKDALAVLGGTIAGAGIMEIGMKAQYGASSSEWPLLARGAELLLFSPFIGSAIKDAIEAIKINKTENNNVQA